MLNWSSTMTRRKTLEKLLVSGKEGDKRESGPGYGQKWTNRVKWLQIALWDAYLRYRRTLCFIPSIIPTETLQIEHLLVSKKIRPLQDRFLTSQLFRDFIFLNSCHPLLIRNHHNDQSQSLKFWNCIIFTVPWHFWHLDQFFSLMNPIWAVKNTSNESSYQSMLFVHCLPSLTLNSSPFFPSLF